MAYLAREAALRETLTRALTDAGETVNGGSLDTLLAQLHILREIDLREIESVRPGWYTASAAYEAVYRQPIPTQGLAIRLGHQLREKGWHCRTSGPRREYWIAPKGIAPTSHAA
jgi:hypothetical protein